MEAERDLKALTDRFCKGVTNQEVNPLLCPVSAQLSRIAPSLEVIQSLKLVVFAAAQTPLLSIYLEAS
jgi:hypothetical protein